MELLGIRFVPFNAPLKERLQVLLLAWWFVTFMFGPISILLLSIYIFLFTRYYLVVVVCFIWVIYDRKCPHAGGRRFEFLRSLKLWNYFCDYFPLSIHKTADLPPNRNYLLCAYPHGMLSCGPCGHFTTNCTQFGSLFPSLTPYLMVINSAFATPFVRDLILGLGMCAASKEGIIHLLRDSTHAKVVVIMLGGAEEASYCIPNTYKIILKRRKGFVRVALETGTPIVPVFSFGETNVYNQVDVPTGSWMHKFQLATRKLIGLNPCIPVGRGLLQYNFGFIPLSHPISTVVGKPIEVPKMSCISEDIVDKVHKQFTDALVELFEENKGRFEKDPDNCKLVIV